MGLEAVPSNYYFVRQYLECNPKLPLSLCPIDQMIRQLTLLRPHRKSNPKPKIGESIMNHRSQTRPAAAQPERYGRAVRYRVTFAVIF